VAEEAPEKTAAAIVEFYRKHAWESHVRKEERPTELKRGGCT
jgi:hypothetical protein